MKQGKQVLKRLLSGVLAGLIVCMPGFALAESEITGTVTPTTAEQVLSSVIITEVLTGTKTSGVQEFIELYNPTDDPIDLTGWQLWYLSAQAADQNKPNSNGVIRLGEGTDTPIITAHGYYVLSGRADYLTTAAQQFYGGTMAATGGNLRLLASNSTNECLWDVHDQVGWGNALYPEGTAASAPPAGQSIARQLDGEGEYVDTHNNAANFVLNSTPTPGQANAQHVIDVPIAAPVALPTVPIAGCTATPVEPTPGTGGTSPLEPPTTSPPAVIVTPNVPADTAGAARGPVFPASDIGLTTPQITELLPNPVAPQTDASDEFIELYNSNDVPFDLSGFQLQVGLATKRHYVFPQGTSLPAKTFVSFFSADTGLALSNSGGQVSLLDPFGNAINQSEQYSAAKDGQSWQLANGAWYWSITPTPHASNVVTLPPTTKKKASTAAAKKSEGAVKAASTTKPKTTKATEKDKAVIATTTPNRQLHPGVLAVVGGFALLYGAYEYRQDMANKVHQFRANRAARRAAGTEVEGR